MELQEHGGIPRVRGPCPVPGLVYRAHPLLDPDLPVRKPGAAKYWQSRLRELSRDPTALRRTMEAFVSPLAGSQPVRQPLRTYLEESDRYVQGVVSAVLPEADGRDLRLRDRIRQNMDLPELLSMSIEDPDPRGGFEARRKLYLAKLLFDIDHSRSVRDGPRHRALLEQLLEEGLWVHARDGGEGEVCCRLTDDPARSPRVVVGVPPSGQARCWTFRVRRLEFRDGSPTIDVYHWSCRFKRDADGSVPWDHRGTDAVDPGSREGDLRRRSGSILGKMLRRGIADANLVPDILGAKFIVRSRGQAYALERRLLDLLGGPFRWRDRVDTLADALQRGELSRASSGGFRVLKGIMDLLVEDIPGALPYLFPVEIQILPLEPYLRTIHEGHSASHAAYKSRQLLEELVPVLFPDPLYGGPARPGASR